MYLCFGVFSPLLYLEGEWREMEQRPTGRKADECFFSSSSFFEWNTRDEHAEQSKKKGAKEGRREADGLGGSEPTLGSRLEGGQRGACRL